MGSERTSTARSRELGEELRAARRRAGLKGVEIAKSLEWSTAKLSKLEAGVRGTTAWEVATLLGRCQANRATRDRVRLLAAEAEDTPIVRFHGDQAADDLACLVAHERIAVGLTCYEPGIVPVLLQSEDYARAVRRADPASLLRRQVLLDRISAVFYLHEAALSVVVGGRAVMHDQMLRLAFLSLQVVLRVVPSAVDEDPTLRHPSAVLRFAGGLPPLAHTDTDLVTVFTDDERALRAYDRKHRVLDSVALTAEESRAVFLRQAEWFA